MGRLIFFVIGLGMFLAMLAPTGEVTAGITPVHPTMSDVSSPSATTVPITSIAGEVTLLRDPAGHFRTDASVNGQNTSFVVDTGADIVALTVDDARRIGIAFDPAAFTVIAQGASGPVRGQEVTIERVELGGHSLTNVRGAVLEGLGQNLLGQTVLGKLGSVQMEGDKMVLR